MLANLFDSTTIPVLQEVVNFSQARHTVLAGNIANMDTPGYKVRDLSVEDFQSRLQQAIEVRRQPPASSETVSPGEIGLGGGEPMAEIAKNTKTIMHHDQNNVGMEHQVTEMVKNQMQHNMALSLMVNQFRLLETAISERV
jgi:flagellar basal-body rod protein FlgB